MGFTIDAKLELGSRSAHLPFNDYQNFDTGKAHFRHICQIHMGMVGSTVFYKQYLSALIWIYHLDCYQNGYRNNLNNFQVDSIKMTELCPLFSYHFLDKCHYNFSHSWCTKSDGALLIFFMRVLKEKVMGESRFLEEYQQAYEQCVYCLYNHPNRKGKARHLQDHNAPRVTLQWKEAKDIYEYFKPKSLPEFDGYKSETISAEVNYRELLIAGRIEGLSLTAGGITVLCP